MLLNINITCKSNSNDIWDDFENQLDVTVKVFNFFNVYINQYMYAQTQQCMRKFRNRFRRRYILVIQSIQFTATISER